MIIRRALREDLAKIVALLVDDVLGKAQDHAVVDEAYEKAFEAVQADPRNELVVVEDGGEVVACLQVTYIPGLGRHGAERTLVEAVRVRSDLRGRGIGEQLMGWVVDRAQARSCGLVQLTPKVTHRRPSLLRAARLRPQPCRHEADPVAE